MTAERALVARVAHADGRAAYVVEEIHGTCHGARRRELVAEYLHWQSVAAQRRAELVH